MKTYFVVLFKAWEGGRVYTSLSNYYFKTEKDARNYAQRFVERSTTFSEFEIKDIMPHIV